MRKEHISSPTGCSATLGARYSHEKKRLEGKSYVIDANLRPTGIVGGDGPGPAQLECRHLPRRSPISADDAT